MKKEKNFFSNILSKNFFKKFIHEFNIKKIDINHFSNVLTILF